MNKREIARLPEEEQAFIYSYGLERESYDTIKWYRENLDLAVYRELL